MKNLTVRDILGLVPMGRMVLVERDAVRDLDLGGTPAYCACSDVTAILRSGAPFLDYPVSEGSLEAAPGHVRVIAHPTAKQIEALRRAAAETRS